MADFLEDVEGIAVVLLGVRTFARGELTLEQLPETLPRHPRALYVQPVVQFILLVGALLLGLLLVVRLCALAFASARFGVEPLEHEGRAVLEPLHPYRYAFLR